MIDGRELLVLRAHDGHVRLDLRGVHESSLEEPRRRKTRAVANATLTSGSFDREGSRGRRRARRAVVAGAGGGV